LVWRLDFLGSPSRFPRGTRDLGCPVALADFGTGYGTFTEARIRDRYALKIGQSFGRNILQDPEDERVVNTIALVARAYGLTSIAEGMETAEVMARLAALGVDSVQTYIFGKPKPIDG
jgi:EAL domain-containing protein (putative c-di-GMP-specific phosphodiesterase class I)